MRSDVHVSEDVFLYMTASICVLHVVQSEVEEEVTVSMSDVYGLIILLMMWLEEQVKTWRQNVIWVFMQEKHHTFGEEWNKTESRLSWLSLWMLLYCAVIDQSLCASAYLYIFAVHLSFVSN